MIYDIEEEKVPALEKALQMYIDKDTNAAGQVMNSHQTGINWQDFVEYLVNIVYYTREVKAASKPVSEINGIINAEECEVI